MTDTFYNKDQYTYDDILSLIANDVEESIYIEFKEANALDKSDGKKKDISKDISAFANSDGGIIIYGIAEKDHKAYAISFIDGNEYTKEWLEQVITSTIQRQIPDLKIFPIRENGDIKKTLYVVKIPKSLEAPHISKDKRFYKRFNFQSVPIEEYEVRELYKRKSTSKLVISYCNFGRVESDEENTTKYLYEAGIGNEGDLLESIYKLNAYINNFKKEIKVSWDHNKTNQDYTWLENNRVKVSATGIAPIFPTETVSVIRFYLEVSNDKLVKLLSDVTIEIAVFYSHGEDRMTMSLLETVDKFIASKRVSG